jgi:hypothetical protein
MTIVSSQLITSTAVDNFGRGSERRRNVGRHNRSHVGGLMMAEYGTDGLMENVAL